MSNVWQGGEGNEVLTFGGYLRSHSLIEDQVTIAVLSSEDSNVVGEHCHVDPGSIGSYELFQLAFY